MEGFPYFFDVRAGNPVLKHPYYQKYNMLTMAELAALNDNNGVKDLTAEMEAIILTNDNMPILWYMRNLLLLAKELGY